MRALDRLDDDPAAADVDVGAELAERRALKAMPIEQVKEELDDTLTALVIAQPEEFPTITAMLDAHVEERANALLRARAQRAPPVSRPTSLRPTNAPRRLPRRHRPRDRARWLLRP
jgi:hypothetical protein